MSKAGRSLPRRLRFCSQREVQACASATGLVPELRGCCAYLIATELMTEKLSPSELARRMPGYLDVTDQLVAVLDQGRLEAHGGSRALLLLHIPRCITGADLEWAKRMCYSLWASFEHDKMERSEGKGDAIMFGWRRSSQDGKSCDALGPYVKTDSRAALCAPCAAVPVRRIPAAEAERAAQALTCQRNRALRATAPAQERRAWQALHAGGKYTVSMYDCAGTNVSITSNCPANQHLDKGDVDMTCITHCDIGEPGKPTWNLGAVSASFSFLDSPRFSPLASPL
jgi:hypothetical protein